MPFVEKPVAGHVGVLAPIVRAGYDGWGNGAYPCRHAALVAPKRGERRSFTEPQGLGTPAVDDFQIRGTGQVIPVVGEAVEAGRRSFALG